MIHFALQEKMTLVRVWRRRRLFPRKPRTTRTTCSWKRWRTFSDHRSVETVVSLRVSRKEIAGVCPRHWEERVRSNWSFCSRLDCPWLVGSTLNLNSVDAFATADSLTQTLSMKLPAHRLLHRAFSFTWYFPLYMWHSTFSWFRISFQLSVGVNSTRLISFIRSVVWIFLWRIWLFICTEHNSLASLLNYLFFAEAAYLNRQDWDESEVWKENIEWWQSVQNRLVDWRWDHRRLQENQF